ncbi:hypothetical protein KMZ68_18265 [Bradyrhizobium sediminis]|uniref:Uncharacterized protein n=1 Tax=Bradyrhizobium sediminis TaxID=2840469 RepID=A0A975NLT8_9BRAD|nr:hypothetical protein [Bradyrhizobium sediminis]QWG16916.1 hypothetical protein KMZ68_18265 [Bradyrhizobium sediminis]
MDAQSGNNRTHRVPAATAAVLAAIGIASFLFAHFASKADVSTGGISMTSTAVVERAGATLIPTKPRARPGKPEISAASRPSAD